MSVCLWLRRYFLFQKNFSIGADDVSTIFFSFVVSLGMTLTAEQLEVVPIKSDLGIVNRDRIYLDPMMYDLPRLIYPTPQTVLAEIRHAPSVTVPAILPALRTVERFCEILSHDKTPIQKSGRLRSLVKINTIQSMKGIDLTRNCTEYALLRS